MWFALCVIAGLAVGGVIAWLLGKERSRKELAGALETSLSRAGAAEGKAAVLEATLSEFRKQNEQQSSRAEEDLSALRERFAAEHEGRVRAETERKEVFDRLEEEKQLLAQAREKLTGAEIPLLSPVETSPHGLQLPEANGIVEKDE
jgi:esterase/lipase